MRAEKKEGGRVATIAVADYRDTKIIQEQSPQIKKGGYELNRDQSNKRERENT